jgi:hypothetical protein
VEAVGYLHQEFAQDQATVAMQQAKQQLTQAGLNQT